MRLTETDKQYLQTIGYTPADFRQIEMATSPSITVYKLDDTKVIPLKTVLELLSREEYLSAIGRSAFHWSTVRETNDGKHYISFDSSKLFR